MKTHSSSFARSVSFSADVDGEFDSSTIERTFLRGRPRGILCMAFALTFCNEVLLFCAGWIQRTLCKQSHVTEIFLEISFCSYSEIIERRAWIPQGNTKVQTWEKTKRHRHSDAFCSRQLSSPLATTSERRGVAHSLLRPRTFLRSVDSGVRCRLPGSGANSAHSNFSAFISRRKGGEHVICWRSFRHWRAERLYECVSCTILIAFVHILTSENNSCKDLFKYLGKNTKRSLWKRKTVEALFTSPLSSTIVLFLVRIHFKNSAHWQDFDPLSQTFFFTWLALLKPACAALLMSFFASLKRKQIHCEKDTFQTPV